MFFIDGYVTPWQVTRMIAKDARHRGEARMAESSEARNMFVYEEFWAFCETGPNAYALDPSGHLFSVDDIVLQRSGDDPRNGLHFTPRFGILGVRFHRDLSPSPWRIQSYFPWTIMRAYLSLFYRKVSDRRARERLGKFAGSSLLFKRDDVISYLSTSDSFVTDQQAISAESSLTRAIVDAFDRRLFRTKEEAVALLGNGFGRRAFGRAWSAAALEREALSRAGRRSVETEWLEEM